MDGMPAPCSGEEVCAGVQRHQRSGSLAHVYRLHCPLILRRPCIPAIPPHEANTFSSTARGFRDTRVDFAGAEFAGIHGDVRHSSFDRPIHCGGVGFNILDSARGLKNQHLG